MLKGVWGKRKRSHDNREIVVRRNWKLRCEELAVILVIVSLVLIAIFK